MKLTEVNSPVTCARTTTVDAAITVPIPCTDSGTDFWTTGAVVTGTAWAFAPPPRPPLAGEVDGAASPPEQAAAAMAPASMKQPRLVRRLFRIIQIARRRWDPERP